MSGIFGSVTIKGNRITDAVQQTATVGIPIPFGYGKFPVAGNVVGVSELRERVIRRRQGKGGVKTEDYQYNLDYAIGFCAGPIYGYWTIKRNGKVVYSSDPTTPIEDQAYATKWLQKATLYYGTEDQEPDSTLEAIYGVGQVSAMKGLAYIVVEDDDVTADVGAVPNYEAIPIANSDGYLTTPPYALETVESFNVMADVLRGTLRNGLTELPVPTESFGVNVVVTAGTLRDTLTNYTQPAEAFNIAAVVTGGDLRLALVTYDRQPAEQMAVSATVTTGTLQVALITNQAPNETFNVTAAVTGGTLT